MRLDSYTDDTLPDKLREVFRKNMRRILSIYWDDSGILGQRFNVKEGAITPEVKCQGIPSPFLSETKHQQQQQGVCIFSCIFANASRRMAATAILPSAGVGA